MENQSMTNSAARSAMTTRDMAFTAVFAVLIAVGAFIRIPVPVVPFTLQLLFTMSAGIFLGPKYGALSIGLYLILGLAGLPIFTEGGGIGYLIGFLFGAWLTGFLVRKNRSNGFGGYLLANLAGLLVVYAFGAAYCWGILTFYTGEGIGLTSLFLYCILLPIPGDILLSILGAWLAKRIIPAVMAYRPS